MTNITNFQDILGATNGDKTSVLGKVPLFLACQHSGGEGEALAQLCEDLNIPYSGSKRISVSDAFRSATGDIKDRITVKSPGAHHIYAVYCRDNAHTEDVCSRELVGETLNQRTNQYEKLANIFYDRRDNRFGYDNIGFDADIDPISYCRRAEELFELYQICANRRQIETICLSYLRMLEATKVSTTGHLYFIPRQHMDKVDTFETFIEQLSDMNQNDNALSVNSFYIIDDAKQRDKMTEEFYSAVKKEIALYQEKADYLIQSGSRSPSVMERWVNKIATLEQKKQHYEEILRRELDGLDDEFETLRLLSQELSVRANGGLAIPESGSKDNKEQTAGSDSGFSILYKLLQLRKELHDSTPTLRRFRTVTENPYLRHARPRQPSACAKTCPFTNVNRPSTSSLLSAIGQPSSFVGMLSGVIISTAVVDSA
ncbi:MAG: DUF6744 family protein [Acutalibacteraceae bacterium]